MAGTPGGTNGSFGRGGQLQCTAKSKRSGVRCKGVAVVGSSNQKCRMHGGGHEQFGPSNPNFKNGRHSRFLPSHLTSLYADAIANPDILELTDHIALLESIQKSILAQTQESPVPNWRDVGDVWQDIRRSLMGKPEDVAAAIERMDQLIENGRKWDTSITQVKDVTDRLRALVDTEVKRKKELAQMVPVERVLVMVSAIADAVKRNVGNPNEVAAVHRELQMLIGTNQVPGRGTDRLLPMPGYVPPDTIDVDVTAGAINTRGKG